MKALVSFAFVGSLMCSAGATPDNIREESLRLIGQDVKSGGASIPKDWRPKPLKKDAFDAANTDVVILPKLEVTEKKRTKLDAQLAEIEKQQKREEEESEPNLLDSILNPSFLGGASAESRARGSKGLVEVMDWERLLVISLHEAKSPEEKARIKNDIDLIKGMMREMSRSRR